MSVVLEFDGLTFTEDGGVGLHLGDMVGWSDSAAPKLQAEDRPQGHGYYESVRTFREGRAVTVEASYTAADLVDALRMRRRLAAMQAGGVASPFRVTDDLGTLSARMKLAAKVRLPDDIIEPFFAFSFQVSSASPFRFGDPVPVSTGLATPGTGVVFPISFPINFGEPGSTGRATAVNEGTAETFSTFTVGGGAMWGGFTLVHVESGRQIRVDRDIPMGSSVVVDSRTGTVLLDGASPIPGSLTRSEWWPVPAGGTATVQFLANGATSGTPTLTVATAPASL